MAYIGKRPIDTFPAVNAVTTTLIADNAVTSVKIAENAITTRELAANIIATGNIADNAIDGTKIAQNSILTRHIDDAQVTADQLASDAVITVKILDANITSAKIANNAILTQHIDDAQVTIDQLSDDSVGTAEILDLNVTTAKIANNAITAAKLPDNVITATHIPNDLIDSEHYAAGSIDNEHLADDAVGADELASSAVVTASIVDNAVTIAKMAGLARGKIIYGDASGDPAALAVGSNGQVLTSDGTDISWGTDAVLTTENVQDIAGGMFSSNTETGVTVTYQDGDGTIDVVVGTLNQDTTGTAALATSITAVANNSTNETVYPTFIDGATGTQGIETDTGWTYNPSTGVVTATQFTGAVVGNVTGNASGTAATVTGGTQAAITSAANLVTVGTIGTGVWQGTAVASGYIAADAITGAKIADDAIDSEHYTDGSIDTAHIAASQITNALMADDAIDSAEIADGSIDTAHIADDQVTAAKLANTAVTAAAYGSSSAIPVITIDAQGRITAASTAATSSVLTIAADSGSNDTVTVGTDTLTFAGTANEVNTTVSNNQIQVGLPDNVTIGGNLIVTGDYTVNGTTSTNSVTNMVISDNLIELNNGAGSNANDSGIVIERGSTGDNAIFAWDESADKFIAGTTTATGSSTGNLTITTGTLVANVEGNVTGNVTGNTSGTSGSTTGNAATATALATARTIGGTSFDGTANIAVGLAATATALASARTIHGVSFDGTANIDLSEVVSDTVGAMFSSNTETGITATYQDGDNTIDLVVGTLNQDTTGTAALATSITAVANNSTDETVYPTFIDGATGTQGIETDTGLTYNPSSGTLTSTVLVGALTGNVTGNASGTAATVTGGTQASITSTANLVTVGTIGTGVWQGTAIASGYIAADAITGAKIADDAIDSEHYTDGSIDTAHIADDQVTLAKMAGIARGKVIYGDASGNPAVLALGSNGQVLKSDGTDIAWAADSGLSTEEVQDIAGGMFSSNTETGITATYQDADGTIDLVIGAGDIVNSMLADDAVGADELAANAVVSNSIVDASIVGGDIAANTITVTNLADSAVESDKIANNAILTQHIDDNQITGDQLADDIVLSGTGSIRMPDGTTAQRPGSAAAGMFRYNTTLGKFEGYTSAWGEIGGGTSAWSSDTMTGDGSDATLTLSAAPNSEADVIVFIDGVFQNQDSYNVSGTTLTFDTAPVSGRYVRAYTVKQAISGTNLTHNAFSGDGSDTTFTLSIAPTHENNTQVYIDGVYQFKGTYSVSGTTLTFSTAPPNGTAIECMTMNQLDINVPVDDTITTAKIADNAITSAKIAAGVVVASDIADDSITLAKMAGLARGKIIYGDASGNPAALAVGSNTQVLKSDGTDISWGTDSGGAALTGSTNNTVCTVTGSDTFQGEANLTFDGSTLAVAGNTTMTTADNSDTLTLISTDADANAGPNLRLYRNSSSPTDDDVIGKIDFEGRNNNSQDVIYANIQGEIMQEADGSEDGQLQFGVMKAGTLRNALMLDRTEVAINEDSVDLNFRVESNLNTHAFFIDGAQNSVIGVGVTPEGWETDATAIQVGGIGAFWGKTSQAASAATFMSNNVYDNAGVGQAYIVTDEAAIYKQDDGIHTFQVSASGSADAAISWTNAMTITNAGKVFIGGSTDNDGEQFKVEKNGTCKQIIYCAENSSARDAILALQTANGGSQNRILFNDGTGAGTGAGQVYYNHDGNYMAMHTNGTEHFRIASNGDLTATDTSIASNSDQRLKTSIENYSYDISKFKAYTPRIFDWRNPEEHGDKTQQIGFIAQELETVDTRFTGQTEIPVGSPDVSLVSTATKLDGDEVGIAKTSKFGETDAMYISVIQQLITRLETAEAKITALEG